MHAFRPLCLSEIIGNLRDFSFTIIQPKEAIVTLVDLVVPDIADGKSGRKELA